MNKILIGCNWCRCVGPVGSRKRGGSGGASLHQGSGADDRHHLRLERLLHRHQRRRRHRAANAGTSMSAAAVTRSPEWSATNASSRGHCRRPGRLSLAVQPIGCSAWKARATGPTSRATTSARLPARPTGSSRIDAFGLITGQIGYAWNNVLFYVKGGGAVVGDSTTSMPRRARRCGHPCSASGQRDPLGRHGRRGPRVRLRPELVAWASSTTTSSSAIARSASPARRLLSFRPNASARTSIWASSA